MAAFASSVVPSMPTVFPFRRPPRDATLPLNPFEISDQQQAKIPPRRQRRTPHRLRVEALTLPLYKLVEPTLLQQLVQPLVERMCHRPRPLRVGNPKLFLRLPLLRSSSHRHARSLRTSALDYARNFTSESRLSPRTASGRLSLTVAFCRHSNPIAHRVRRSRYEVSCWGRLRSRLATMRPESCPLSARSRVDEEEAAHSPEETSAQWASAGAW